jgi:hypothetical protein
MRQRVLPTGLRLAQTTQFLLGLIGSRRLLEFFYACLAPGRLRARSWPGAITAALAEPEAGGVAPLTRALMGSFDERGNKVR